MKYCFLKPICLLSATVLLLCGCSWSSQEMPEIAKIEQAAPVLADPLTLSEDLTSSDGSIIAKYNASFPQFEENGIVAQRINDAFLILYEDAFSDKESFFNHVKTHLGEDWESKSFDSPYHTVDISNSIIPSTDDYICILSEYEIRENEIETVYPRVRMFLASTGWSLTFETLFGENTAKATELLISQITEWCRSSNIPTESLSKLDSSYFDGKIGIGKNHLFICFDPYFFSTQYDKNITVYLPLSEYSTLLIEHLY